MNSIEKIFAKKKIPSSILYLIGNTPLVRLSRIESFFNIKNELYAKLEMFNPGGSVKDRIALFMVEEAEKQGIIRRGSVLIEPTSGNTGIGLALTATVKGYKLVVVMPRKMSREKELLLKAYGAFVVRTPTEVPPESPFSYYNISKVIAKIIWSMKKMITKKQLEQIVNHIQKIINERNEQYIRQILNEDIEPQGNAWIPNQYFNKNNPLAHYLTTAREILSQLGEEPDYIFAGMGTGGTITGIARYFRGRRKKTKIIGVDPEGSIFYYVKKEKMDVEEAKKLAHPYNIEGIGEDILPDTIDLELVDDIIKVNDQQAFSMARFLAKNEGILAGSSSGAALYGAIKYVKNNNIERKKIIVILPDTGRNYLTKFYNDEWMLANGFIIDDLKVLGEIL